MLSLLIRFKGWLAGAAVVLAGLFAAYMKGRAAAKVEQAKRTIENVDKANRARRDVRIAPERPDSVRKFDRQ